jgi:hypothetical protein
MTALQDAMWLQAITAPRSVAYEPQRQDGQLMFCRVAFPRGYRGRARVQMEKFVVTAENMGNVKDCGLVNSGG